MVTALSKATEPSLSDTNFGFNGALKTVKEMYRNHLVHEFLVIPAAQLDNLKFEFRTSELEDGDSLQLEFTKPDFQLLESEQGNALFKLAASRVFLEPE